MCKLRHLIFQFPKANMLVDRGDAPSDPWRAASVSTSDELPPTLDFRAPSAVAMLSSSPGARTKYDFGDGFSAALVPRRKILSEVHRPK